MKLNVKAFAFTCALVWGFGLFFITWWMIVVGTASSDATFLGRVYLGYRMTPLGSVIGLAWAFVDGLIGGAIFAWLYNAFVERALKKKEEYRRQYTEQLRRAQPMQEDSEAES